MESLLKKTQYKGEYEFHSKSFGRRMFLIVYGDVSESYINACAEYVNTMPEALHHEIREAALRACLAFNKEAPSIGETPLEQITEESTEEDIRIFFRIGSVHVYPPEDESIIGFVLHGDCEWKMLDPFDVMIRDGKIIYVGDRIPYRQYRTELVVQMRSQIFR